MGNIAIKEKSMKKKVNLTAILAGEYKETIDIMEGLSIVAKPMSFKSREEVSRLEEEEFNGKIPPISNRNMFIGKNMAKFVIKSANISSSSGSSEEGKEIAFNKPEDVEVWLNSLPSSIAEMTISSVINFVTFYVKETEAAHNRDPFDLKKSAQKQSSPPEVSS